MMENEIHIHVEGDEPAGEELAEVIAEEETAEEIGEAIEVAADSAVQIAEIEANKEIVLAEINAETALAMNETATEALVAQQEENSWQQNIEARMTGLETSLSSIQTMLTPAEPPPQSLPELESPEVMPDNLAEVAPPEPVKRPRKSRWI